MATVTGTKGFPSRVNTIDDEFRKVDERSFTLIVSVDPDTEGVEDALLLAPPIGSGFIGLPQIWLGRRTPRQISRRLIEVDLEFVQRPPGTPPDQEATPNPVDWSPKWLGSSVEKMQRVMSQDAGSYVNIRVATGAPPDEPQYTETWESIPPSDVILTNGEAYSTPVYETVNILVARWRRYYPIAQPALDEYLLEWNNTINSATFRGKPAFTWLLTVNASPTQVNNFELAELTFDFRYNKLGWIEERLQVGTYYIDQFDGNKRKPFIDGLNNPISGLLNVNGNPALYPTYKKHRGSYEEKDFNDLLT